MLIRGLVRRCIINNVIDMNFQNRTYYCTSSSSSSFSSSPSSPPTTNNARFVFDLTRKQLQQAKNKDVADSYMLDSRILFEHVLGQKQNARIPKDLELTSHQLQDIQSVVNRRLNNEPIAYIVGHKYFWKHKFKCNHSTLIPRPDSETLIEQILELYGHDDNGNHQSLSSQTSSSRYPKNILDLGTGTGCLLLTLLDEFPNSVGVGIDQSLEALKVAKENANTLKLNHRSTFIQSNWIDAIVNQKHQQQQLPTQYDLIISNPPYIDIDEYETLNPTVKQWEPITALVANDRGLKEYDTISKSIIKHNLLIGRNNLSTSSNTNNIGYLVFEIGYNQEESVKKLVIENGFEFVGSKKDLGKITRSLVFKCK